MRKLFKSGWLVALGLLTLSCLVSCEKEEDADNTPRVSCTAGSAGSASLGENVKVYISNIDPGTVVTVKFGREKTITRTGPGSVSYAFTTPGLKSIRVTTSPEQLAKTVWLVEIKALESIQSLAAKLKEDPNLCLVMCHRANSSDWSKPENSLSAINKCIEDKVDIVEIDLWTTKDGVLVVSHDETVNRVTNGSGYIKNLSLSQIKSFSLKDRNGNTTSEKMLTFDELLDACNGNIYVNVDLGDRQADVTQVVQAITRKGMIQQCLVYCNSVDKVEEAYKANPECNVYTWCSKTMREAMRNGGIAGNNYFTQCTYYPQSAETSRSGQPSQTACTSSSTVADAAAAGFITTVNAIYTLDTQTFYPRDFKEAQVKELFSIFPSCQCLHVDTGAEARAALIAFGKSVTNR